MPVEPDGIPFVITTAMKARLRGRGFTAEQLHNMTPQQAHEHLSAEPAAEASATPCATFIKDNWYRWPVSPGNVALSFLAYSDDSTRELFAQRLYCTTGPIPKDEGEAAELIAKAVLAIQQTI
jgi:hypothetical protein